jgi:hypothetical protein
MTKSNVGARAVAAVTGTVFALSFPATFALSPAQAATGDRDGDGIPNRWERTHGMNPFKAADAKADFDRDGLTNVREYRNHTALRDEDTDNDGHDDGDEVKDGLGSTDVDDADTDNDGVLDGDEDADRDGTDNEDEDDARESCRLDDDDRDRDAVDDEDENEFGLTVGDADSDNDGIDDGDEDSDEDGEANEDSDDTLADACTGDRDGDGEDDEDSDDLVGTIASYDAETGLLTVNSRFGFTVSGTVTEDTEIEFDERDSDGDGDGEEREATTADLQPGVEVAELDFDDETGALEEVEIYPTLP